MLISAFYRLPYLKRPPRESRTDLLRCLETRACLRFRATSLCSDPAFVERSSLSKLEDFLEKRPVRDDRGLAQNKIPSHFMLHRLFHGPFHAHTLYGNRIHCLHLAWMSIPATSFSKFLSIMCHSMQLVSVTDSPRFPVQQQSGHDKLDEHDDRDCITKSGGAAGENNSKIIHPWIYRSIIPCQFPWGMDSIGTPQPEDGDERTL